MYDAASPAVRLANTGPEGRLRAWSAARPRWASAVVIGCQSFTAGVEAVGASVLAGSTRAYQYHAPTRRARITRKQPNFRMRFVGAGGCAARKGEYPPSREEAIA